MLSLDLARGLKLADKNRDLLMLSPGSVLARLHKLLVPKLRINRPSSKPMKILKDSKGKSCSSMKLPALTR